MKKLILILLPLLILSCGDSSTSEPEKKSKQETNYLPHQISSETAFAPFDNSIIALNSFELDTIRIDSAITDTNVLIGLLSDSIVFYFHDSETSYREASHFKNPSFLLPIDTAYIENLIADQGFTFESLDVNQLGTDVSNHGDTTTIQLLHELEFNILYGGFMPIVVTANQKTTIYTTHYTGIFLPENWPELQ